MPDQSIPTTLEGLRLALLNMAQKPVQIDVSLSGHRKNQFRPVLEITAYIDGMPGEHDNFSGASIAEVYEKCRVELASQNHEPATDVAIGVGLA